MKKIIYVFNILIYFISYYIITFSQSIIQPEKTYSINGEIIEIFSKESNIYIHILYILFIINLICILTTNIKKYLILIIFSGILIIFTLFYILPKQ